MVLLDGKKKRQPFPLASKCMRNDYAQTFAKGLIAEMKEMGCSSKCELSQLAGIAQRLRASVTLANAARRED